VQTERVRHSPEEAPRPERCLNDPLIRYPTAGLAASTFLPLRRLPAFRSRPGSSDDDRQFDSTHGLTSIVARYCIGSSRQLSFNDPVTHIAVAIRRSSQDVQRATACRVQLAPATAFEDLGPLIFGDHALDLQQQVIFGRAADVVVEVDHLDAAAFQLVQKQDLAGVFAGQAIRGVDIEPINGPGGCLVAQAFQAHGPGAEWPSARGSNAISYVPICAGIRQRCVCGTLIAGSLAAVPKPLLASSRQDLAVIATPYCFAAFLMLAKPCSRSSPMLGWPGRTQGEAMRHQVLLGKPNEGKSGLPLTRSDWYAVLNQRASPER
jgi:hypothetical protein